MMSETTNSDLQGVINTWLEYNGEPLKYKHLRLFHPNNFQRAKGKFKKGILKVAVLPESPEYHYRAYAYMHEHHKDFDHIFTCDKKLLSIDAARFHYIAITDCWVLGREGNELASFKKPAKTKNISAVFSEKRQLSGHGIRHLLYQRYKNSKEVDFYGTITGTRLDHKSDALLPYRFSLAVENCRQDFYFTEKVIDCLACATLPLYWGSKGFIEKHFNPDGFLHFDGLEDLPALLEQCTPAYYKSKLKAVQENQQILNEFPLQRNALKNELLHLTSKKKDS